MSGSLVGDTSIVVLLGGFMAAAVRVASPLLLAALGETVSERGGVLNLALEGSMLCGALAAALGAKQGGPWIGLGAAILAGAFVALVLALISVWLGADQVITGTALTLAAIGVTGAVYRQVYGSGGVGLTVPTFPTKAVPLLHHIPILGPAFFAQPAPVYLSLLFIPLIWAVLFRSRWGLSLRACGESSSSAAAAGVRVRSMRAVGVIMSGAMGGLGGATLVLAQVGTFAERMTAGRGFVAIAIVVLGRWNPLWVAAGALLFGVLSALQYLFQAKGIALPYQLFMMMPYLVTLLALAGSRGRAAAPAELGRAG
ncbi:MAG: ABC transporter permease [Gemmatimonadota bacterium]